ncbi:MAG TPA: hypothetical protein VJ249_11740 [Candidatus Bathyarchaeia archaeon]|nr:hypothetical protein [Candidatus Bathyarchaeia archaeon]
MKRSLVAQRLLKRLNEKVNQQLTIRKTLILGVVLKGLPIAYGLARMNRTIGNFVPLVAQRHIYMQHQIESYFPSLEWITYFYELAKRAECVLVVDDVVNTGFTRQKVEGIVHSLAQTHENAFPLRFASLILNRKKLANPSFVHPSDIFALEVNAWDVECDWGVMKVPLWNLPVEEALQQCESYYEQFWLKEKRWATVYY